MIYIHNLLFCSGVGVGVGPGVIPSSQSSGHRVVSSFGSHVPSPQYGCPGGGNVVSSLQSSGQFVWSSPNCGSQILFTTHGFGGVQSDGQVAWFSSDSCSHFPLPQEDSGSSSVVHSCSSIHPASLIEQVMLQLFLSSHSLVFIPSSHSDQDVHSQSGVHVPHDLCSWHEVSSIEQVWAQSLMSLQSLDWSPFEHSDQSVHCHWGVQSLHALSVIQSSSSSGHSASQALSSSQSLVWVPSELVHIDQTSHSQSGSHSKSSQTLFLSLSIQQALEDQVQFNPASLFWHGFLEQSGCVKYVLHDTAVVQDSQVSFARSNGLNQQLPWPHTEHSSCEQKSKAPDTHSEQVLHSQAGSATQVETSQSAGQPGAASLNPWTAQLNIVLSHLSKPSQTLSLSVSSCFPKLEES